MTTTDLYPPGADPATARPRIYESQYLLERIEMLDPERKETLSHAWANRGLPAMDPMLDAESYAQIEDAVAFCEPSAPVDFGHVSMWNDLTKLPPAIADAAREAITVYAGMADPSKHTITTTGRIREMRRIITQAEQYAMEVGAQAEAQPEVSSVTELPEVDDTPDFAAMTDYPGNKAKAGDVMAWVGEDLNRAARAYVHEQDRANPRKGVTEKLEALLGDDLAKVRAAMAQAEPPPMDLGAAPATQPEPAPAGEDVPITSSSTPDTGASGEVPAGADDRPLYEQAADATPNEDGTVTFKVHHQDGDDHLYPRTPMADALDLIGAGFVALAAAIREGGE